MKSVGLMSLCAVVVLVLGSTVIYGEHSGDVWVGRSAEGQLVVSPLGYVPDEYYTELSPISGFFNGWGDNDPGFDHPTADQPEHDCYMLESGAEIWLEVVAIDPAFRIIDSGLQYIDTPGEQTYLGTHTLHIHNDWHINSDDPAYDPEQCVWSGTFVLHDQGVTGYTDSEPLTFSFTNFDIVLEPGDFDGSGTVDLEDYVAFEDCMAGPDAAPDPSEADCPTLTQCLVSFDFDEDDDVDLRDFAEFQRLLAEDE